MNELVLERTMTVKEIAEILNVDVKTVTNAADRLGVLGSTYQNPLGGRPARCFTENEATIIKQEIQKHHNLASRQIDNVSTQAEENALINQAIAILNRRAMEFEEKARIEKERADRFEATNKLLMHSMKLYTVTEIAKELGYPSAIELNKILEEKGIQYKVNGTWVPSAKFSGCGYFEIKQEVHDNGFVYYDRKVTQEGREFILKLLA